MPIEVIIRGTAERYLVIREVDESLEKPLAVLFAQDFDTEKIADLLAEPSDIERYLLSGRFQVRFQNLCLSPVREVRAHCGDVQATQSTERRPRDPCLRPSRLD